jgi:hypothetical protein
MGRNTNGIAVESYEISANRLGRKNEQQSNLYVNIFLFLLTTVSMQCEASRNRHFLKNAIFSDNLNMLASAVRNPQFFFFNLGEVEAADPADRGS